MTGGGWTVIQRRQDGSENFYRLWDDYVNGFGNRTGEYWLGLETMRIMTTEASTLRIELESFGDLKSISAVAEYSSFAIGSSASNYKLTVSGYSGTCGDSLSPWHNGRPFSTADRDNDLHEINCAVEFKGAWWYKACHQSNLNGMYLRGVISSYADGIIWETCWGLYYSVKTSVMKIRRL
jgi:ficolin